MGFFAARRRKDNGKATTIGEKPLSKGLIFGLLVMVLFLGYLTETDRVIPTAVIGGFAVCGLLIMMFASFQQPAIPIYAMVAYLPFSKILAGDFGGVMTALNLTNLLMVVLFVSWMVNTGTERRAFFEPNIMHLPIGLMAAWAVISFQYAGFRYGMEYTSYYFPTFLPDFKRWMDPVILYFFFYHLVRKPQVWKNIVVIMMISVAIVALMAVHDYITESGGSSLEESRVGGIAGQPNILGAFFVYYMFLYFSFWLERLKKPGAWALLLPFLLCFRGIMVTFSRGAYLAFAQGLLGISYFKNKVIFVLMIGLIAFVLFNPWVLPAGIRYRLESTMKPQSQTQMADPYEVNPEENLDTSSAVRLMIWRGALLMIGDNPIFGIGLGKFPIDIHLYIPLNKYIDAHNAYIITAAEMGIPALIFFLSMLALLMWMTSYVYKNSDSPFIKTTALGFLGGLSGLLMANMFGSRLNTTEVSGYFWILAALMARAYKWILDEKRAKYREARLAGGREEMLGRRSRYRLR